MIAPTDAELQSLCGWQPMSVDRYAALEAATGVNVARIGSMWWQRVRPFFYRPLLSFKTYDLTEIKQQFNRPGFFQIAVRQGQPANSRLNPVIFEDPRNYDIRRLRDDVRGKLKKALKNSITVSRMLDERQFSEEAYPVYLSFHERTSYGFESGRKDMTKFRTWAKRLFHFSEALVLGAYADGELVSFEITCLVGNTLVIKTVIPSGKALKLGARDLLLHSYRLAARERSDIHLIYDSLLSSKAGQNNYKVMRGARVLALPAFLHMPGALQWLVKKTNFAAYERVRGLDRAQLAARGYGKSTDHDLSRD